MGFFLPMMTKIIQTISNERCKKHMRCCGGASVLTASATCKCMKVPSTWRVQYIGILERHAVIKAKLIVSQEVSGYFRRQGQNSYCTSYNSVATLTGNRVCT